MAKVVNYPLKDDFYRLYFYSCSVQSTAYSDVQYHADEFDVMVRMCLVAIT